MERSEPTLIPEWLRSGGSVSGGGTTNHHFASSFLQSDDHAVSKAARIKSSASTGDRDIGCLLISDRSTYSNFRRSYSNGSARSRSYSSSGRSNCDRDWEKDIYEYRDKDRLALGDHMHRDYSVPLEHILPGRLAKDMLKRSESLITGKRGDMWSRKVAADSNSPNTSNHSNGNRVLCGGSVVSGVQKTAFERNFPSLGAEESQRPSKVGRVTSLGFNTAFQSLIGTSAAICGPGRTSALAEVPVIIGNNSTGVSSVQQTAPASSASISPSKTAGLNMAEALAQGPPRARTAPQSSVGSQRLEELAIIQSRRLIPVTPSMPKPLVLSPLEKPKSKIGQMQPTLPANVPKTSNAGKLLVLKPAFAREKNGVLPSASDISSPTNRSKVAANSSFTFAQRTSTNQPDVVASAECKSSSTSTLEKKSTSQAQSRNDFFNLVRKKSCTNYHPSTVPSLVSDKSDESIAQVEHTHPKDLSDACIANNDNVSSCNNGEKHSSRDVVLYSEEEEAVFLRSLGWVEESAGDDEGLTEQEITEFYNQCIKLRPSSKLVERMQPKNPLLLNLGGASSE